MESIPVDVPIKNYGFVVDNRKCIVCHACSVACKSENEVPLGVNRTWVKYVETGRFPIRAAIFRLRVAIIAPTHRVRICRLRQCTQRTDGIVEFDNSVCIGLQSL